MTLVCEDLATKAELQELRNQINQLLGQPEEEGGLIDVLGLGSLDGTLLAGTIFLAGTAMQDLQLTGSFGSNVGQALLKNQAQFVKVSGRGVQSNLNGLQRVAKANAGRAAIGAQGAKLAGSAVGLVANLATIVGTLGLNIATVKILGDRIDQNEKAQLLWNQDYTNLINILNRNNQVIEDANAEISDLQTNIAEQQVINSELSGELETAQRNIEELEINAEAQQKAYTELETVLENFKTDVAEYQADTGEVIEGLETTIVDLESNIEVAKTNLNTVFDTVETLSTNLADAEARLTEQEIKITELQIISSVQIAELTNLQIAIDTNQDLTDARLESLEAQLVLSKNTVASGGGTSGAVKENITNQQNKTLELMNKLAGNPVEQLPDIQPNEYDNTDNPFNNLFDQLLPQITPGTGGDLKVDVDELSTRLNDDFTNTLTTLGIVGLTDTVNDIRNQTTATAISNAAETAVCRTTQSGGCMANDIKTPIVNGQNNLQNNITNLLQGLDLTQGQNILNVVQDTNNFMKTAWRTLRVNKVLDYLNTVLLIHNAAMLSKSLAVSLGDSISVIANNTVNLIKNEDDSDIDINETLGNTLEGFLINLLGSENYNDISETFQKSSRILNAATNIVNTIQFSLAGMAEGLETIGNYTGKIGNSLKKAGAVFENAYGWMSENFTVKTGRLGQVQAVLNQIETVENVASDLQNVTSEFREVQENVTQIGEQFNKIKTEVTTQEEEKTTLETTTKTNSQGVQPTANDYTPDPVE